MPTQDKEVKKQVWKDIEKSTELSQKKMYFHKYNVLFIIEMYNLLKFQDAQILSILKCSVL